MRPLLIMAVLSGCAAEVVEPPPPVDAGPSDSGVDPIFEPSPVAEPEAPRIDALQGPQMTPCPDGWREVPPSESGLTAPYCDPLPSGSMICPADQAHLPGTAGCARVGSSCPASDPWAEDLPTDRTVVYAAPGGSGNGTRSNPYGSISEALAATPAGVVIALADGRFDETVRLDREVTLWGACTASTEVTGIVVSAQGVVLRNLRIGGGFDPGVTMETDGASLSLRDVVVQQGGGGGVVLDGQVSLSGEGVVIRESQNGAWFGRGLVARNGASVELTSLEAYANRDTAILASGPATEVLLTNATIRDTQPSEASRQYGIGVLVVGGARLELTGAALERNRDRALWVSDPGSSLVVTDAVVRNTRPQDLDDTDGIGAQAQAGGSLVLSRVTVDGAHGLGVYVSEEDASAELTDVIVMHVESQRSDGIGGRGVNVQVGASLAMTRAIVHDTREQGVFVGDASAILTDLVIDETKSQGADGLLGTGLTLNFGATAEVDRLWVSRARQGGIAAGMGSTLALTDAVVEDSLGQEATGADGIGLVAQSGSMVEASRLRIERGFDQGVFARDEGTSVRIEDLIVRDILSSQESGKFGRGLAVEVGAVAEIDRALIERTQEHAIMANGSNATIYARDVRVDDTRARDLDGFSGRALAAQHEAHVEITRGRFSRSVEVGIFISGSAATATLTDVIVEATESRSDGVGGRGLDVNQGGRVTARGIRLANNREFGVVAVNEGSRVELYDAVVTGTRENACPEAECLGFGRGGTGVAAAKGAAVVMERFRVEMNALAGLALTRMGTIDLFQGEVAFNPIGVNIDAESYDLGRLQEEVRYHDNELSLQSTSLPEPRASEAVEGVLR